MDEETPVKPRASATVILTRENGGELQVYLMRRSVKSGFMGGIYVFPGGVVDPEDRDLVSRHDPIDPSDLSGIIRDGLEPVNAYACAVAALRETFEEAGVLLLDPSSDESAEQRFAQDLRRSGCLTPGWLQMGVGGRGWSLAFAALLPWAHWITPVLMPRRFDTRFFIVNVPDGVTCSADKVEMTHGLWVSPEKGLEENMANRVPLSPPTLVTLQGLVGFKTFEQIKAASRANGWGRTILPRLILLKHAAVILEPWDPWYGDPQVSIAADHLPASVLAVGEPFSRLWNGEGPWKPVGCPGFECRGRYL